MAILNIIFNPPGSFSVKPNVIYVVSNDTFVQVQTVGYLNSAVATYGDIFANYYLAVVMTSDQGAVLFQIQVASPNISLVPIAVSNSSDISALQTQINTLNTEVVAVQSSVTTMQNNITTLQSANTTNVTNITANTTAISILNTEMANALSVSSVASVSQMEAATANNVYVSPLVVNRCPAVAKAWVSFTAAGTVQASYNVASVVKNSAGLWTITYTVPFSSANYDPIFTAELTLASLLSFGVKAGTRAASSIQVTTSTLLGILADPAGQLYFVAYGDQ